MSSSKINHNQWADILMIAGLLLPLATSLSCGGAPVRVSHFAGETKDIPYGIVYYLPKSLLEVSFKLKIEGSVDASKCAEAAVSCVFKSNWDEAMTTALDVRAEAVPDPKAAFVIRSVETFVVESEFSAELDDKGQLARADAKSKDQTVVFATLALEGLAKVALRSSPAGPDVARPAAQLRARRRQSLVEAVNKIDERFNQLIGLQSVAPTTATGSPPPDVLQPSNTPSKVKPVAPVAPVAPGFDAAKLEELRKLRDTLTKEITEIDKTFSNTVEIPVSCTIVPDEKQMTASITIDTCLAYQNVVSALQEAGIEMKGTEPEFAMQIEPLESSQPASGEPEQGTAPASVNGFVYRVPRWYRVTVAHYRTKTTASKMLAIPQFGGFGVLAVGDDDLRSDKQVVVELHPGLGSLKKVTLNGKPVSAESLGKLRDAATAVINLPEEAALARLEAEKKRLEAELAVLEARKQLEEAQKPKSE